MEDDSVSPVKQFYNISESSSSSPKRRIKLSRVLITVLILCALGGTAFAITQAFKSSPKKIENSTVLITPTTEPTPTAEPTPTPEVSTTPSHSAKVTPSTKVTPSLTGTATSKNVTVEVLNGNGTAGVGKKASDILKNLGYTVSSTGNADNFDYAKTEIHVKSGKTTILNQLKKDLSTDYTIGSAVADLPANSSSDAQVIIGKE